MKNLLLKVKNLAERHWLLIAVVVVGVLVVKNCL